MYNPNKKTGTILNINPIVSPDTKVDELNNDPSPIDEVAGGLSVLLGLLVDVRYSEAQIGYANAVSGSADMLLDDVAFINVAFEDDAASIQAKARAVSGYEQVTVVGSNGDFQLTFVGIVGDPVVTFDNSTMEDGEATPLAPTGQLNLEYYPSSSDPVLNDGSVDVLLDSQAFITLDFDDNAASIQVKARAVSGYEEVNVTDGLSGGFEFEFVGSESAPTMTFANNTLIDEIERVVTVSATDL